MEKSCCADVTTTLKITKLSFIEEATAILLFLFGVPGAAYSLPVLAGILYYYHGPYVFFTFVALLILLSVWPVSFNVASLTSWPANAILRYFSFKCVATQLLDNKRPYVLVAPPHGLFVSYIYYVACMSI